jgi:hypothetical protein
VSDDNDDSNRKKRANGHSVFIFWKIHCRPNFFLHHFFARGPQRIAFPGGFAKDA